MFPASRKSVPKWRPNSRCNTRVAVSAVARFGPTTRRRFCLAPQASSGFRESTWLVCRPNRGNAAADGSGTAIRLGFRFRHAAQSDGERTRMGNLNIEVPEYVVRSLEGIAAAQRKSIQQLAQERLSSLVEVVPKARAGSPTAVLRAMQEPPHPSSADVDELDAAMLVGRLPIRTRGLACP